MSRFILMSQPRTGSRLLCSLLSSHPAIACPHEVLAEKKFRNKKAFPRALEIMPGRRIVVAHGHHEYLTKEVLALDAPKILLTRKDYIRAAQSALYMNVSRAAGFYAEPSQIKAYAAMRERLDDEMRQYADFEFDYSDFANNDDTTKTAELFELQDFIGASRTLLKTTAERSIYTKPGNLEELYA